MIRQCYMCAGLRPKFSAFAERWGLRPYGDSSRPAVFYGVYGDANLNALRRHRGLAVVVWCGTDAQMNAERPLFRQPHMRNVATSRYHARRFGRLGLRWKRLNLLGSPADDLEACDLGDEVYAYAPSHRPREYGRPAVLRARAALEQKGIRMTLTDSARQLSREGVVEAYRRAFVGIRLTSHDGAAASALELGLMGRRSICNGDAPCCVPWKNEAELVSLVIAERDRGPADAAETAEATRGFLQTSPEWLDEEFWR